MMQKISHFLLRGVARCFLEPRLRRGVIRPDVLEQLKPALKELNEIYENARQFFDRVNMCRTCSADCCGGDFNRYTVLDHISHAVASVKEPLEWSYKLYLFSSFRKNHKANGWCRDYMKGAGCRIEYSLRPAMCVWWICDKIEMKLDANQKAFVSDLRNRIDRIHWKYALALLFGGIRPSC